MRIGIDGATWTNARGYGRFTRELVRAMVQLDRGHTYTLFLDGLADSTMVPSAVRVVRVPVRQSPERAASADGYRSPPDMWAFSRAIATTPIDMIFFPSVYTFVPVLRPMKVVVGVHDVIPERFPDYVFRGRRARLFWRLKSGLALRQATRVLTVSEHARQGIQACLHVAAERIGVTSEAPAPAFRPAADDAVAAVFQQLSLTPGQRVIVYFGGITPHKNIHMLVSVFADLIQDGRFADVRLVIAGDYTRDVFYSAYPAVRAHVEAACLEAVTFTGYIDDETAASLLTGAQVCVLPSLDEGFGLPGIEAAACGTPVIATRSSALPEVLGDAALYIDPTNPVELNAALERVLLDGALRQSMGARGLERAQRLSWQSAAERALHVFEGML